MCGGSIAKIVLGIVLALIGLWMILPASVCGLSGLMACKSMWQELWLVLKGVVPLGLLFLGAMLIWIETEELMVRKKK